MIYAVFLKRRIDPKLGLQPLQEILYAIGASIQKVFVNVLQVATKAADDAQRRVSDLEERGMKRAGETLRLINNLLAITERAAAKAAGAQYDFVSKTIESLDRECQKLISQSKISDDRDLVAKRDFRERVRVLTKQIDSLDIQIITYNESVPKQFSGELLDASESNGTTSSWNRLELTGPCLFIRGISNHLEQNFDEAVKDWMLAVSAKGASAIKEDANYWIGYVLNTLGDFDEVTPYLQKAIAAASTEQRKVELVRLELETRFFALKNGPVPTSLLEEGAEYFNHLELHRIPGGTRRNFATTMGNISLVHAIRSADRNGAGFGTREVEQARDWFKKASAAEAKSRWAKFGNCQCMLLASETPDDQFRADVREVLESVKREYQNRVEDRSKALSRLTEYMCMLMLSETVKLSDVAASIEYHASMVTARTMYSQFRKQNIDRDSWLKEFHMLEASKNLRQTYFEANRPT